METLEKLFTSFNFLSWFLLMLGMQYSAGPANILVATSVGKMGFKRSVPVITGLWLPALIYTLVIGFGFNTINREHDVLLDILTLIGTLYIFYLGYTFFQSSHSGETTRDHRSITFKDGVILSTFNGKMLAAIFVMYSVALTDRSTPYTILLLTFLFLVNGLIAQLLWGVGGKLFSTLSAEKIKLQNYTYGLLLIGVAVWMIYLLLEKYM